MQFDPRFERTTQHLFLYLWFPPPLFFFSLPERYPPRAFSPFNSLPPLYCAACHNVYEYTNPLNFKIGQQNQNADTAVATYKNQIDQINNWEDTNKQQLMDEYNQQKKVLNKLKASVPDWKKSDIDAESENKLNELHSKLNDVSS